MQQTSNTEKEEEEEKRIFISNQINAMNPIQRMIELFLEISIGIKSKLSLLFVNHRGFYFIDMHETSVTDFN